MVMGNVAGIAAEQLQSLIERIERLEEEKQTVADDIKEVYAEAKGHGFDTKIMRQVIRLRKMEPADRLEQESLLDLYKQAIGMVRSSADTPADAPTAMQAAEADR